MANWVLSRSPRSIAETRFCPTPKSWASVPCWIPEQISPQLRLFALFDDQALRKTLTPIEQASLYGEYQQLYAAQAKLRQQATRFGHDKTTQTGAPGSGESPEPSAAMSRNGNESRVRAAIAVTGTDSHQRLEQIRELQVIAADVDEDPFVRDDAAEALAGLNQDGKVNPRWRQVKLSQQRARQDQAAANPGPPPEPADPHAIQKRQARLLGDLLRREHGWWHRYNPETFARFAEPDAWQLAVTYRAGVDTFMDTATLARTTR